MATITKLTPGQMVYSIERQKMGNTTLRTDSLFHVKIVEIDLDNGRVLASWNGNVARWWHGAAIKKWRINKPEPKNKNILGQVRY